ncbi:hypothetical protein BpHYR1_040669 [Brachionus plicatilis]|uniref:Uncharacterized protein n=1 Tax=Brachionus plicatilis TaxID=10195 RepID=A0A3M7RNE6_BRAPC|nr:hypothetical protein BpHYR1_040669 [Brachionus plicatilis]
MSNKTCILKYPDIFLGMSKKNFGNHVKLNLLKLFLEGIVPLGSSERRSAFFSASLYIKDFDLSKTALNFCCDSFGLLERKSLKSGPIFFKIVQSKDKDLNTQKGIIHVI